MYEGPFFSSLILCCTFVAAAGSVPNDGWNIQENQSFPIKCATKLSIARIVEEMMINFCESLSRSQNCSRRSRSM